MMKPSELPTPCYVVYEDRLRRNLELIDSVRRRSGAEIIMAFKANALWRTFPIIREYGFGFTASSINELTLGCEELHCKAHTYCPAYTDSTIGRFLEGSSHITFNSISQAERFMPLARKAKVSAGLRVNPQCSVIDTDIYNPALPGSRFGVTADMLNEYGERLPDGIEGLHFHALCESGASDLQAVLSSFESQFAQYLPYIKWVNMGGGHLMTRKGYDVELLIQILTDFRTRYPHIKVILEPGSAFTWRTGDLLTTVVDIVTNQGISTAIIDASFACHMPDCLEMPYKPLITESLGQEPVEGMPTYRLGGNSCLSGDFAGPWSFEKPLYPGCRLTLEDMNHYTTVKTTMFNGLHHPDMVLCTAGGECEYLRRFDYLDYKNRMD
ncbi:MAG: carboxynorspermidine decarboxylase [Muribaculaceae bacterium]|nr:carboxynorspermidine decarboxylase [Muribaculaceae bacterium]